MANEDSLNDVMADPLNFLTVGETARILRKKDATIRTWLRNGILPGYKFPGGWRVRVGDLQEFIESYRRDKAGFPDEA